MNFNNMSQEENRWAIEMTFDCISLVCVLTTKDFDSRFTSESSPDSSVLYPERLTRSEGGFKSGPLSNGHFQ